MGEKRSLSPTTVAGEAASSTSHVAKRARAEDLASASPEIKSDGSEQSTVREQPALSGDKQSEEDGEATKEQGEQEGTDRFRIDL